MSPEFLPKPFCDEQFDLFQKGTFEDALTEVHRNRQGDFACLWPQPKVDYAQYEPRVKKLKLGDYKKTQSPLQRRLEKLRQLGVAWQGKFLEVGAADGMFLQLMRESFPGLRLYGLDPDKETRDSLAKIIGAEYCVSWEDLSGGTRQFDFIGLFHVLEHITEPRGFLAQLRQISHAGTRIIIEVPALTDPLLSLYQCKAYQQFYFQRQHPYYYSGASLCRLLEYHGFKTETLIAHQRYGLENHLAWLMSGKPGGNEALRSVFTRCGDDYLRDLEASGKTDTVIWVGRP